MLALETTSALYIKEKRKFPHDICYNFFFRLIYSKALQNLKTV